MYPSGMTFAELSLGLEQSVHSALARRKYARSSLPAHLITGERGEDAAYFHLRSLGYTIVARRWRSEKLAGDIDLAAWDGDTLVFFEIEARTRRDFAPAETQVDPISNASCAAWLPPICVNFPHVIAVACRSASMCWRSTFWRRRPSSNTSPMRSHTVWKIPAPENSSAVSNVREAA
jgi:hypothetical protein